MTSTQRNVLATLANANNQFDGTLAFCVKNADILRHRLFEVGQNDLQDLGFGKLQSEAFFSSLTFIAGCQVISRQTNITKAHIAHIVSLLKDANKKLAAIENAEYDAKVAEIAALPKVAELLAKATKVRNLTAELETCSEARFFEIANAIDEIGYSYQTNFSSNNLLEQVLAVFGKFENYQFFTNCAKFSTSWIRVEAIKALRDAAIRLQILYIYDRMGEAITEYCDEVAGMQPLYVLDKIVGWYNEVAQPTPDQPTLAQTTLTAAQSIEQQADAAKLPLNEYMELYSEAGGEFEKITFNEARDEYAQIVAIEETGSEDAPIISDKFVAAFATFIINRAVKEKQKFLTAIGEFAPNASLVSYELPILDGCQDYQINLYVKNSDYIFKCLHLTFEDSPTLEGWYIDNLAAIYELAIDKKPHTLEKELLAFFTEILSHPKA